MTTNAEECWTLREHRRQLDPALFGPAPARDERFLEKRRWIECANFPNDHPLRIIEFFHRQMNEELNGVENGAESLADSPDADWKVLMSIARRCADEARHVEMFRRTFEIQGGKLGEYPGLPWFLQPSVPFRGLSAHRLDRSKIRFTLAKAVPWAGKYILHSSHRMMTPSTCSGDTLYDFVQALCFLGEAFATALLWYFLDRHQANYERIHGWLRFYVRLSVGAAMLMYGSEKIFRMNFQQPNLYKILALLGDYSLMGWARMGASGSYSIFAGCVQMLGGVLLFVPRLTTLGALVGTVVFSNIFALNLCYGLPLKLSSFLVLLGYLVFVLPAARRLVNFFLLNRSAAPSTETALFKHKRLNAGALVAQLALGRFLVCSYLYQTHDFDRRNFSVASRPPFYGIWTVDEFKLDGKVLPPLLTDQTRSQRMVFQFPKRLAFSP